MSVDVVAITVCVLLIVLLLSGLNIFVCLGFAGALGIFLIRGWVGLGAVPSLMFSQIDSFTLVAVPLFILMGNAIFHTGIGKDLFEALSKWTNRVPGGLAVASIFACAAFGAMCGVSIVGVVTIGVIAVPEMLNRGYDKKLAAGSITASGALAMLIPPSVLFILYGALANVSVGALFIGGIVPGVVMAVMMAIYVIVMVIRNPKLAPFSGPVSWGDRFRSLKRVWPSLILIFSVLGTIYLGVCTPTESGAIGTVGALLIGLIVYRSMKWETFKMVIKATVKTTSVVMIIVACALVFGRFLDLVHIPEQLASFCANVQASPLVSFGLIMLVMIILGMFIDGASMVIILTPILLPTVLALGFDPLWFGIMMVININIAVISPPVGLNLYALKSITPNIEMGEIISGTLPYIGIEIGALLLFMFWPEAIIWLPSLMR